MKKKKRDRRRERISALAVELYKMGSRYVRAECEVAVLTKDGGSRSRTERLELALRFGTVARQLFAYLLPENEAKGAKNAD